MLAGKNAALSIRNWDQRQKEAEKSNLFFAFHFSRTNIDNELKIYETSAIFDVSNEFWFLQI